VKKGLNIILNILIIVLLIWLLVDIGSKINLLPKLTEIRHDQSITEVNALNNIDSVKQNSISWIKKYHKWIKIEDSRRTKQLYILITVILSFILKLIINRKNT